ncbi:hypothetical protein ACH5RR_003056 [Cinchona calisaya]|uniref:Uncharacterized protein n=1 Tax=Cinchona calisaya TaxID=153742 RepID=A0ABD3ATP7_9GENT
MKYIEHDADGKKKEGAQVVEIENLHGEVKHWKSKNNTQRKALIDGAIKAKDIEYQHAIVAKYDAWATEIKELKDKLHLLETLKVTSEKDSKKAKPRPMNSRSNWLSLSKMPRSC